MRAKGVKWKEQESPKGIEVSGKDDVKPGEREVVRAGEDNSDETKHHLRSHDLACSRFPQDCRTRFSPASSARSIIEGREA